MELNLRNLFLISFNLPSKNLKIFIIRFILYVFFHRNFSIWEVDRKEEFSPLKNCLNEASDNELSCKRDILEQHYKWLVKAGAKILKSQSNE